MASYMFNIPFVKYYREHLDEYATILPYKIANTKNQTFYAKATITNPGNLGWTWDDGGTEKNYTLDPNSLLSLSEKLIAGIMPTETQKDQMTIKVEYFKDSSMTKKLGEDTITVNVHIYIQNSDLSWTSSNYTNESDIVFDKFDFSETDIESAPATAVVAKGVNGKVQMYTSRIAYASGASEKFAKNGTIYISSALKILQHNRKDLITFNKLDNTPISGKILTMAVFVNDWGYPRHRFGYPTSVDEEFTNASEDRTILDPDYTGTAVKVVWMPVEGLYYGFITDNADYVIDGVYVFNLLP